MDTIKQHIRSVVTQRFPLVEKVLRDDPPNGCESLRIITYASTPLNFLFAWSLQS